MFLIPKEKRKFQGVYSFRTNRDPQEATDHVVAQSYQVIKDPQRNKFGVRLFEGAIHQIPPELDEYHQVVFSTYDFWLKIPIRSYGNATRMSYDQVIDLLNKKDWKDSGLLRRLMEHYKDLGFPVAVLLLGMLGLPVGIVSRRSGRAGGFAIGVAIILGFYLLNVFGEFLVTTRAVHPFVGAWFPNAMTLLAVVVMYIRASRK